MRILLLDGSAEGDAEMARMAALLRERLQDSKQMFEWTELRRLSIVPCTGCFGCWTRTPGTCVQDDDARRIMQAWMSSDVVVLFSRITFGCYSSLMKQALDRQIGMLLPYYSSTRNGVEHLPRYQHYPSLLALGVCDERDEKVDLTFKRLVAQNGRTMRAFHARSQVLCSGEKDESLREKIESSVMGMKVRQ
jgi:hypothetical protein